VSASSDNTIRVWDVTSGAQDLTLRGHEHPVTSVAISPDGTRIISATYNDNRIWDAVSGHQLSSNDQSVLCLKNEIEEGWIVDVNALKKPSKIPSIIKTKSWLLERLTVKHWFSPIGPIFGPGSFQSQEEGSESDLRME
jgi:WD40 repeat protein